MLAKIPFPAIFNEQSLLPCARRADFIARMRALVEVVRALRAYGYGMHFAYSRTIFNKSICPTTDLQTWLLKIKTYASVERELCRQVWVMLKNGIDLEKLDVSSSFDLWWNGRLLYGGSSLDFVPGFLVSCLWRLPTVALACAPFAGTSTFLLQKDELMSDGMICRTTVALDAFSEVGQVTSHAKGLEERVLEDVQSGTDLLAVCANLLPRMSFSANAENALARISFEQFPVVPELIYMQNVFDECLSLGVTDFRKRYGRPKTLAMSESDSKMAHYPRCRDFRWPDGATRTCQPHVRVGNHGRIHFVPDFTEKVLYVGYIGPHLDP